MKKKVLIYISVLMIVSIYSFIRVISFPTNSDTGMFGFSIQRISLLLIPFLCFLLSIGCLISMKYQYSSFQKKVNFIRKKIRPVEHILISCFFWLTFIFGAILIFYQYMKHFQTNTHDLLFGIPSISFFAYCDRLWSPLLIIFCISLFLFLGLLQNCEGRRKLGYYVFLLFYNQKIVLSIVFIVFLVINLYNLYWLRFSTGHPYGDDFNIYFNAFLKAVNHENPYLPYDIGSGFINHPFLLSVISVITNQQQNSFIANIVWSIISIIAWILTLIVNFQVIDNKNTRTYLFFLLLFTFGPFYEMLYVGQVNAIVVLLISLVFHFREKEWVMGILLAFAIVLKTSPMILFAFLFVSKRWKAILSCSISLLVLSLIPIIQFQDVIMTQFLTSISQVGFEIAVGAYNESIVSQVYSIINSINVVNSPELITRIIISGMMIAIVGALSFVHYIKDNNEYEYLLFICLNLVMVIFSPLVWYHHFVFLIIPIIGLYAYPLQRNKVILLIGSALFLIQTQRVVEIFSKPGFPTLLVSVFMIAYFLLLYFSKNKIRIKDIKRIISPEKLTKNSQEMTL